MTTMKDRAEEVGGHVEVRTGAGGTTLVATLPTGEQGTPTGVAVPALDDTGRLQVSSS